VSALILSMILATLICGVMWRRPDARAAAAGAWQAGAAQAAREFREGYDFAQSRLRVGDPSWKNPRRWASAGLGVGYGTVVTLAAGGRIVHAAWRGARDRHREWQASRPVDAEIIEEPAEPTVEPRRCGGCGSTDDVHPWTRFGPDAWYCLECGLRRVYEQRQPDPGEQPEPTPDPQPDTDPNPEPDPQPNQSQEEPDMQTEATGLTSYAAAHTQFAGELRAQMSGSENLAASMSGILAEHSDLIGQTAVLQDLLNQAATIADQIAERATEVANN
jgi:hypothetical protein